MSGGAGPALALGEPQQLGMALQSPFGGIAGNWEWVAVAVEVLPPAGDQLGTEWSLCWDLSDSRSCQGRAGSCDGHGRCWLLGITHRLNKQKTRCLGVGLGNARACGRSKGMCWSG